MITRNYIKMCEQAKEIQKLWGCKKGDWIKYQNKIIVLKEGYLNLEILEKDYGLYARRINQDDGLVYDGKGNYLIWLPTQEQLQEMMTMNTSYAKKYNKKEGAIFCGFYIFWV